MTSATTSTNSSDDTKANTSIVLLLVGFALDVEVVHEKLVIRRNEDVQIGDGIGVVGLSATPAISVATTSANKGA